MLLGRIQGFDFRNRIRSLFTSVPSLLYPSNNGVVPLHDERRCWSTPPQILQWRRLFQIHSQLRKPSSSSSSSHHPQLSLVSLLNLHSHYFQLHT
uniref:Uncharacterized protein n=1 Tax=Brassica campestris TaxID=3711 RepID=A0A3P6CTQ1_BRACM|nr:unnamed protein product [Brassica rapa]